ncbi:MAG: outer membrane lipoprotein chaperone LolA [Pseudomonadota bacterium]|nr:outer membrane lipoprotein chaperone LolA [Pseudomonadota bacterium]
MLNSKKHRMMMWGAVLMTVPVVGLVHASATPKPSVAVTSATPAATEAQAAVALTRALSKLNSLEANFTQRTITAQSKQPNASQGLRPTHLNRNFSGVMQVKRPGQFRWETTSPMSQLIVANQRTVWIYDPDLEQATRQQMDEQVGSTPALLLSGQPEAIMKAFRVTQPNRNQNSFILYPLNKDGAFESLAISFAGDAPQQMTLKDSLGQRTEIQFSQVKLNPTLSDTQFKFVPPAGTDVIDQ